MRLTNLRQLHPLLHELLTQGGVQMEVPGLDGTGPAATVLLQLGGAAVIRCSTTAWTQPGLAARMAAAFAAQTALLQGAVDELAATRTVLSVIPLAGYGVIVAANGLSTPRDWIVAAVSAGLAPLIWGVLRPPLTRWLVRRVLAKMQAES